MDELLQYRVKSSSCYIPFDDFFPLICYEEDAQESVVLRELLDKKLWKIPDRIKDKGQFEEKLNQSIRQYHPEYWRARQSGREAAEAARSTAPAKEAAR